MPHYVQIIEKDTKKVVKQIECQSERLAASVERGVQINLNHKDYTTKIVTEPSADCKVDK